MKLGALMEKTLEKGEDKIRKICLALKNETLEPAKEEAERIVVEAKKHAERILSEAKMEADKLIVLAKQTMEQERKVFHSSLEQASRQAQEELRQAIETELFDVELQKLVEKSTKDPQIIADLIKAIVHAIEKEGITANLSALVPKKLSTDQVNALLGKEILNRLKSGSVALDTFSGGVKVKLHDQRMTIDVSDTALLELLSNYVRKDFRKLLFKD